MPRIQSFDPIIGADPKIMILGSMPGVASLEAQQYYAHPRNAFWPIMAELFAVQWSGDYARRVAQLRALPVILWDVLKSCSREGSLDTAIAAQDVEANAIPALLQQFPELALIAFNGATAERYFKRHVSSEINNRRAVQYVRLPSTSPAHASLSLEQKLAHWRVILQAL